MLIFVSSVCPFWATVKKDLLRHIHGKNMDNSPENINERVPSAFQASSMGNCYFATVRHDDIAEKAATE